ncbi:hypothetical protein [Sutcliffiella sp. NC1]|uniref:hypothetical protein n=1 Tax=Sutcliffiella sp. NC1 TaxID=3004096 RepID=UPI0022DD52FB|nr:hypothetical protein [Sutcliffiella sp. NC1]WBL15383.1 hypothetical protein O1A01_01600 [Sutcliffiella sp. NC1]
MKNMFMTMMVKMQGVFQEGKAVVKNERGAQTIEWVALAVVILFLMAAVATAMSGQGGNLAQSIVSKISELINKVGQ